MKFEKNMGLMKILKVTYELVNCWLEINNTVNNINLIKVSNYKASLKF